MITKSSNFLFSYTKTFTIIALTRSTGVCIIFYKYEFYIIVILSLLSILYSLYSIITYDKNLPYEKNAVYSKFGPYYIMHYITTLYFWENFSIYYLWAFFILFFFPYFMSKKEIIKASILIFTLYMILPFISILLKVNTLSNSFFEMLTQQEKNYFNYYEIVFMFITAIAHVYFFTDYRIAMNNHISNNLPTITDREILIIEDNEFSKVKDLPEEKFEIIYNKIVETLEKDKLYRNPFLKLSDLAKEAGTNRSYASTALSKKGKSFKYLVNFYRIKQIKEDLSRGEKSLKETYSSAGFNYYSTFAKAFEEIENVKHTEYIRNR